MENQGTIVGNFDLNKSTNTTSRTLNLIPVYEDPKIELLDESEHHDTVSLTRKLNELIKKVNKR